MPDDESEYRSQEREPLRMIFFGGGLSRIFVFDNCPNFGNTKNIEELMFPELGGCHHVYRISPAMA